MWLPNCLTVAPLGEHKGRTMTDEDAFGRGEGREKDKEKNGRAMRGEKRRIPAHGKTPTYGDQYKYTYNLQTGELKGTDGWR